MNFAGLAYSLQRLIPKVVLKTSKVFQDECKKDPNKMKGVWV